MKPLLDLNRVFISGHLSQVPTVSQDPSSASVCNFQFCTTRRWFETATKQIREEINYVPCVAWGQVAESLVEHVGVTDTVVIEGKLKDDRWVQRGTGEVKTKLAVIVTSFYKVGEIAYAESDSNTQRTA